MASAVGLYPLETLQADNKKASVDIRNTYEFQNISFHGVSPQNTSEANKRGNGYSPLNSITYFVVTYIVSYIGPGTMYPAGGVTTPIASNLYL